LMSAIGSIRWKNGVHTCVVDTTICPTTTTTTSVRFVVQIVGR
jgi:hypothetical protein